jgi:hypothetical protein
VADNITFYRGTSVLTGDPIMACLTGLRAPSDNPKTGPMLQTWILRSDQSPTEAIKSGEDDAICGDCKLRGQGTAERACYVAWYQAPASVWKAHRSYVSMYPQNIDLSGKYVRLGSYGDPAALPFEIWRDLIITAAGYTGYTHQWRHCDPRFKQLLMASVDTDAEYAAATVAGWRTFHLRPHGSAPADDEIICPASKEGGYRATCQECGLCSGQFNPAKNIAIYPHGPRAKWAENLQVVVP